jgi:hypothetical protein
VPENVLLRLRQNSWLGLPVHEYNTSHHKSVSVAGLRFPKAVFWEGCHGLNGTACISFQNDTNMVHYGLSCDLVVGANPWEKRRFPYPSLTQMLPNPGEKGFVYL